MLEFYRIISFVRAGKLIERKHIIKINYNTKVDLNDLITNGWELVR